QRVRGVGCQRGRRSTTSCCGPVLAVRISAATKEVVGGQVTVGCSFTWAGNNNTYFCNKTCSGKDILVETKRSKNVSQGRFSIEDKGDVFYVTIKDLRKTDSGTYWCGVDRTIKDTFQEVHLIVIDGVSVLVPHVSTTLQTSLKHPHTPPQPSKPL
uniref:Immunoglobulin domain-containing protein n=1 Tax=Hucho hucho TaxID=62062 RepID=A0A4W5LIW6_9TELE